MLSKVKTLLKIIFLNIIHKDEEKSAYQTSCTNSYADYNCMTTS